MGRATHYCDKCGIRLTEEDFETGDAVYFRNMTFCEECRVGLSGVVETVAEEKDKDPDDLSSSTLRRAIDSRGYDPDESPSDPQEATEREVPGTRPGSGKKNRKRSRGSSSGSQSGGRPTTGRRPSPGHRRGTRSSNVMLYFGIGMIVLLFLVGILFLLN